MKKQQPKEQCTTPVLLTVERARQLLNTKRPTMFAGIDSHMSEGETNEMLLIERELSLKRNTFSTILLIATEEHPAFKKPKEKTRKKSNAKAKAHEENEKEDLQVQPTWEPEDDHDPFVNNNSNGEKGKIL